MPGHLQVAGSGETHDQSAIGLRLQHLVGMEDEVGGIGGGFRAEAPYCLERFFALEQTERAGGEGLQVEVGIAHESFVRQFHRLDVGQAEQRHVVGLGVLVPVDQIMAVAVQETVGVEQTFLDLPVAAVDRFCLPSATAPQAGQGGKKRIVGPPPQPSLPAIRQAILDRIFRQTQHLCPRCGCHLLGQLTRNLPK